MTESELHAIESELQKRGYKKWTTCLTSSESWAWFKTLDKERNKDGNIISGYKIAFRVWDFIQYGGSGQSSYGLDFWTSALGTDSRMDFISNWDPVRSIDTYESMATEFNKLVRKYTKDNQQ